VRYWIMRKFKYRIESFLKYLNHERDRAVGEKNKAELRKANLKNHQIDIQSQVMGAFSKNASFGKGFKQIAYIHDNNIFIERLKAQLSELDYELEVADREIQRKHHDLVELQKRVCTIELHKEIEQNKYKIERKKKEQKQLDELNNSHRSRHHAKSV